VELAFTQFHKRAIPRLLVSNLKEFELFKRLENCIRYISLDEGVEEVSFNLTVLSIIGGLSGFPISLSEEWLEMKIDLETLNTLAPLDIISPCLCEMTFFGYKQDEIKQQQREIFQEKDETMDARRLCLWEEFLQEMVFPENDDVQTD
jgi:hypothetical protein